MLAVLRNPTYARLFSAQIIALLGTGLLTVALGLLAYDIAGSDAGAVMGTVMAIKMVAYVLVSPVTTALVSRLPARRVLIGADLVRAGVAVSLPFVTEAWQTYVLIFLLQSASATFTPTFQAVIPSVLPDEREYTRALSLSRLAYDLESLVSPLLAAALLTVTAYNNLFFGTVIGFLVSAALVALARFPAIQAPEPAPFLDRLTRGTRAYWARLELRGLLGVNLVVATTTAMVIVNTVVLVQADLGRPQQDVALLLAAYGGGSMVVALGLLYSTLFSLPLGEYMPYLAVGLIVWNLISQTVTDACDSLVSAEGVIRQLPLPYTVHALRCVFRNAAVAAHSLPLIAVVFLVCGHLPGPEALLAARATARKEKNWAESDRIRDALKAMGYAVEDTAQGQKLRRM